MNHSHRREHRERAHVCITSLHRDDRYPLMTGWESIRSIVFALLRGTPVGRDVYRLIITTHHLFIIIPFLHW